MVNKIMTDHLGEDILCIIDKASTLKVESYTITNGFVVTENPKSKEKFHINTNDVIYISEEENSIKICYKFTGFIKGKLIGIEGKFISVQIADNKRKNTYEYIIPFGGLQGVKLLSTDEDGTLDID